MNQRSNRQRRPVNWSAILMAVVVSAVVIGGSIGLVRYRNRHRGATQPVFWAVDHLATAPDTVVAKVVSLSSYHQALSEFRTSLEEGALPVDSIRNFYHTYTLWSRDGVFDVREIAACLPYLGLTPSSPRQIPGGRDESDSTLRSVP